MECGLLSKLSKQEKLYLAIICLLLVFLVLVLMAFWAFWRHSQRKSREHEAKLRERDQEIRQKMREIQNREIAQIFQDTLDSLRENPKTPDSAPLTKPVTHDDFEGDNFALPHSMSEELNNHLK